MLKTSSDGGSYDNHDADFWVSYPSCFALFFFCPLSSSVMGIAFTAVPENFDVKHLILKRHQKLFDDGLDASYFDVVMGHFTDTLKEMKVDPSVIEAAAEVIMPLRDIFVQGALEARERKQQIERKEMLTKMVATTIVASVALTLWSILKRSSKRA